MNRYFFDASNNDQENIPSHVLDISKRICSCSHVIDYGAGRDPKMHLEFHGSTYTRIDIDGVVVSPSFGAVTNLDEAIGVTPESTPISLVFFRSFSCLEPKEILDIGKIWRRNRMRIQNLVVYDYAIDVSKSEEYSLEETPLGNSCSIKAEWYHGAFYHYSPDQIARYFDLVCYTSVETSVPATKHANSPGFLLHSR
jgi:hypothetical protein